LVAARRRRAELLLAPPPQGAGARTQRGTELKAFDDTIARINAALPKLLPAAARADKLNDAPCAALQAELPGDAAVVDFARYSSIAFDNDRPLGQREIRDTRYVAFVVTRDRIVWIDLDTAARIEPAVAAWREAITTGKVIPAALPEKVRNLVWAKVRKALPAGVRTVYVCPDAALCAVPFGALPGDRPGTVLLEDFALATVPHAPFLLDKLWPQDPLKNAPPSALVVGGVKYDAELAAPAPTGASRGGDPLLKPGATPRWRFLDNTVGEDNGVVAAAQRKALPTTRLDGDKATTSAVLAALPKARYAHFATHGFFADPSFRGIFQLDERDYQQSLRGERIGRAANSPLVMSGLVFAGANNPGTPGRGILTGEQLIDLDLRGLDLAVLSACETGLGDVAGGEGTFGLQRAFHYAGARNVVGSLWKVPDAPTAALMALFYRNLWGKDLSPMESLRQAQLELYKNPGQIPELAKGFRGKFEIVAGSGEELQVKPDADGKAHPLLWAGFTLSGPGR
jgi:CHAT domain-containing protein